MPSLVLDNVSKRFGGLSAVSGVTMEVPPGRITGLIGPNGAGKTTVVNMITGLLKLTTGTIKLGERDITTAEAHEVALAGVSRTFQNIRLLPEATVLENVVIGFHGHVKSSLFAQLVGLPSSLRETPQLFERGRQLLERFGMSRFADHPAGSLAYGHQRRVERDDRAVQDQVGSSPDRVRFYCARHGHDERKGLRPRHARCRG